MKIMWNTKDGGEESNVTCYGIEIKGLFSIMLLRFAKGSREAYHNHAFNSHSILLNGALYEDVIGPSDLHAVHWFPFSYIRTPRDLMHKVTGIAENTWVLTFRGPWRDYWHEMRNDGKLYTLTHGREVVKID